MRRAVLVSACILVAGAGLFGLVKGIPILREAIETNRHLGQAALREPAARDAWAKEIGDPDRTLAAFPRHKDSQAAVRLIELVGPLGIQMSRPGREQPRPVESPAERALTGALAEYDRSELTRPSGKIGSPPETVRAFLDGCELEIHRIVSFLSRSSSLAWETDVVLGSEAPVPNLLGQIHLQRVLIANALNCAHLGQAGEAEEDLQASWALNASLRDRPDIVSQLIAISVARMQTGLVRRISIDPVAWHERLVDHDYRASLLRAIEVESIAALRRLPIGSSRWDRASRADFLDLRRSFLVGLRNSQVSDGPIESTARLDRLSEKARSLGAIIQAMGMPNLAMAMRRVDSLIVDSELSERILEARLLRDRLGHWPGALPGDGVSRLSGGRWNYTVEGDGRMRISFSRDLQWGDQKGIVLPALYESDP
jgi:hypothetical protein